MTVEEAFMEISNSLSNDGLGARGHNRLTFLRDDTMVEPLVNMLLEHDLIDPYDTPRKYPRMLCVRPQDVGFKVGVRCVVSFSYIDIITAPVKTTCLTNKPNAKLAQFAHACSIGGNGELLVHSGDPRGKRVAFVKHFYRLYETIQRENF